MSPLIETLLWCILQVTLVGGLALALCAVLRRWSYQGNTLVPAAALAAVVVLTACAFAPWPNWWRFGPSRNVERNSFRSEHSDAVAGGNGMNSVLPDPVERNSFRS